MSDNGHRDELMGRLDKLNGALRKRGAVVLFELDVADALDDEQLAAAVKETGDDLLHLQRVEREAWRTRRRY